MPDIMLDLARLREAHTGISTSIAEFKDASDINDSLEDAIAKPDDRSELRGKASDFESAWDGKRETLQENLQNILDQLTAILDGWEKWDTGTAANIDGGGTETTTQSGPSMKSPKGNELRRLEGNASDVHDTGKRWIDLGAQMEGTAVELRAIGDDSIHISKGTTKLAELATETAGDLEKAAIRYADTGEVLSTYGTALDVAQTWIHPRIEDIEAAETAYQNAMEAKEDAEGDLSGLDPTFPWQDEPTDAEKQAAGDAVGTASSALTAAKNTRDDLWEEFDSTFGVWSDAYDDAVDGIQKAMDSADNNDGFWEFVDDLLTVLSIVLVVLSVIALIIGAPLFGLLGLVILGLTLLSIGLTALKFFNGKATLDELGLSLLSLLPFGVGKFLKLGPSVAMVVKGGRGIVATSIRSSLPSLSLLRPTTWATPVRWMMAGRTARLALPRPGMLVNPLKSFTSGGPEVLQLQKFITTMKSSSFASNPALSSFITQTSGQLPGLAPRIVNAGLWTFGNVLDGDGLPIVGGYLPHSPSYEVVPVR